VAIDLATGALLRACLEDVAASGAGAEAEAEQAAAGTHSYRPLQSVQLTLGPEVVPADPGRPESVSLLSPMTPGGTPRWRAVRTLLDQVARSGSTGPLLGSLGPSLSYSDLAGDRPSVCLVVPSGRTHLVPTGGGIRCHFEAAGNRHVLPSIEAGTAWLADDVHDADHRKPSHRRRRDRGAGPTVSMLVVGLGAPRAGQVTKVVLAALPPA
jgi:hypothetical protein